MDFHPKRAASSAQVRLHDDEEFFPPNSAEFQEGNDDRFVPVNLFQDSYSLQFSTLPIHHRNVLENLQHKIGYQINYFSLESGECNEVQLVCKICCKTVDVGAAEAHIVNQKHLRNLAERLNSNASAIKESKSVQSVKPEGTQRNVNAKPSVPLASAQTELNKLIATTESSNSRGRNVARELTRKLKNYMNYFEFREAEGNKSCFTCKMCRIPIPTKNARLHIYSGVHLRNLRTNLSVAKLETLDARNKILVQNLVNQFNDRLFFFQLVNDTLSNELYFICKVCTTVLVPEWLKSHIDSAEHSKNLQENPVVLNYDSLNKHNKEIVGELHAAITVSKIKDFSFVYRIGTEELWFYCKCCQIAVSPDKVEGHVNSGKHRSATKVECNPKRQVAENGTINAKISSKTGPHCTQRMPSPEHQNVTVEFRSSTPATVSRNSFQTYESNSWDSDRVCETVKYANPGFLPAGITSPYALSGVPEVVPNFNFKSVESAAKGDTGESSSNKRLRSDLNIAIASKGEMCFICQDCSTVIDLKALKTNLANKELVGKLFINCCGKSANTGLSTAKNCKVPESNSLNYEKPPPATNNYDFESAENNAPSPVTSNTNFSESAVSNDPNKEILKALIDKIGTRVSEFDFLKTNSDELRFKCKFCGVIMRPETVEDHLKFESHVKYSQLSNVPNLAFESLNDSTKKFVRRLFSKIGNRINDFDAVVTLGFVCKICGAYVKAKAVEDHMVSEEHAKCLSGRASYDDTIAGSSDALINAEKLAQETSAHHPDPAGSDCSGCCFIL